MPDSKLELKAKNPSGKPILARLCDRESVRTLALVERMILEQMRRSETDHLASMWGNYAIRKLLFIFDQFLTFADELESRISQKDFAADVRPDGTGDSDDA